MAQKIYPGIHNDPKGAMDRTGNIIRDAWVFGIIPETETCEGWLRTRLEMLYDQVSAAWQPYGHLPSRLPPELMERHRQIYAEAMRQARDKGCDPDDALADD
ncbi:MAG: hypothetical protein WBM40_03280 [Thiohalocapsa sp.]